MTVLSLAMIAIGLVCLAELVRRARPESATNRWFSVLTLVFSAWVAGITATYSHYHIELFSRVTFAAASFIPATFLAFIASYPVPKAHPSQKAIRGVLFTAITFAALSVFTPLITHDATFSSGPLIRRPGYLYPAFACYFIVVYAVAVMVFVSKYREQRGIARVQLQYLGVGVVVPCLGGMVTNLILPLVTGMSTYSWLGPYFAFIFFVVLAHAIIRHRLMDLRVVVHRSLTLGIAAALSLIPVAALIIILWPRLLKHLSSLEILALLVAVGVVALLVPITRDTAEQLLDRYVYRKQANYQRTVREASRMLTGVLELERLLELMSGTLISATEAEGIAIYVKARRHLSRATVDIRHPSARFEADEDLPTVVVGVLEHTRDALVTDEIGRERPTDQSKGLYDELSRRNWALVLPAVSENGIIGAIALGPKLSGDPFYPQDLDLLMTLANQAGTAIKNAQLYAEVILANQYLHNIVATINSGVIAIDAMGDVTMFNPTAEELTGLRNVPVHERGVGALPAVLRDALLATVQNGIARTHPEIELSDGATTRPIMCTTSPLRDRGDRVLGAVAVFSDLTPVRDLEAERRRAERAVYLETIASGIAHEVKNPLVAIKTFAQLLDRRRNDERFINDFSRVVIRQIDRMERLVERLRSLTRPAPRELRRVDVRVPVAETLEFLQGSFEDKRLALDVSVPDKELPVLGDHSELEQLFLNLLINAHEATPAGGRITVRLGVADDRAVVDVADTGPGIAPDILDRMFDPFVTTKPTGSGLGLTVCARIAAAHGARLRGANTAGGGACFTVEFPLTATVGVTTR